MNNTHALVSYLTSPARIGSPNAAEIPPAGTAVAVPGPKQVAEDAEGSLGIETHHYAAPVGVSGLPEALPEGAYGALIPLAVASAMRELGMKRTFKLFSPGLLSRSQEGVMYAPTLVYHSDLLQVG